MNRLEVTLLEVENGWQVSDYTKDNGMKTWVFKTWRPALKKIRELIAENAVTVVDNPFEEGK